MFQKTFAVVSNMETKKLHYNQTMAGDLTTERIITGPGVRSGQPIIKGTRVTVWDILGWLSGGMSEREILDDFPYLTHADIIATLQFAYTLKDKVSVESAV